jgi:hypothetical protein
MAEYIKHTACLLALSILLVAVWRTPPGDLVNMLAKLWPVLLLLVGWW